MYKFLSKNQRQELIDELKLERTRRYAERIKVILLLDEGKKYVDIAHFLFLDESTIANYKKRYHEGGIEGLILDNYQGGNTKLTIEQEEELDNHLQEKIYTSTKAIIYYIEKTYGVKLRLVE